MPRAKESLKISVEQSTDDDIRTVVVKLAAPAKDFLLPDLLSDQGAIDSYEVALREAVKAATESYFRGSHDAVAAIAERKQTRQSIAPARAPKEPDAGKGMKGKREAAPEETATAPVSRAVPERVNGPAGHDSNGVPVVTETFIAMSVDESGRAPAS